LYKNDATLNEYISHLNGEFYIKAPFFNSDFSPLFFSLLFFAIVPIVMMTDEASFFLIPPIIYALFLLLAKRREADRRKKKEEFESKSQDVEKNRKIIGEYVKYRFYLNRDAIELAIIREETEYGVFEKECRERILSGFESYIFEAPILEWGDEETKKIYGLNVDLKRSRFFAPFSACRIIPATPKREHIIIPLVTSVNIYVPYNGRLKRDGLFLHIPKRVRRS